VPLMAVVVAALALAPVGVPAALAAPVATIEAKCDGLWISLTGYGQAGPGYGVVNHRVTVSIDDQAANAQGPFVSEFATSFFRIYSWDSMGVQGDNHRFVVTIDANLNSGHPTDFDQTITHVEVPPEPCRPIADFDGDGITDPTVFRPEVGGWYSDGLPPAFLGLAGDTPIPGDYDGDGVTERAVYRSGAWFVEGAAPAFFGLPGDVPVPGDYDGDGQWDRAVFRDGAWLIEGEPTVFLGLSTDIPVPADYDGDGDVEPAVFRPSTGGWFIEGQAPKYLGLPGDIPVPGDTGTFSGPGAEIGVYRPSVGGWYIESAPFTPFLGLSGDVPVFGYYSSPTSAMPAVFRPSVGGWYLYSGATIFNGLPTDIPVITPPAIYDRFF
jgi:hypothetical protein